MPTLTPAMQRINHAFASLPYGAHVFMYLRGTETDEEALAVIARNLEMFSEHLLAVAETNHKREEELDSINKELAAAGKLLRRMKL